MLVGATVDASGLCHFTVIGPPALICRIETGADLAHWTTVTNIAAFPGMVDFAHLCTPPAGQGQFFRVTIP
jgi:hypothetical protein